MMAKGLGTLINAVAIIAAGIVGVTCKRFIKESYQDTMIKAAGLAVMFMGAAESLSKMIVIDGKTLSTTGTINIVISLALGGLIGEIIDIDGLFNRFGAWLKHKDGNTRIRRAAKNIQADGNEYYIIMNSAMDNPDVLREMRKLKQDISGKDNVHIISIHSFEFALLSFNLLESWVFAQEDELKDSRQDLLKMKTLFVKLFLSENSSSSLTDFKKTFEIFRSKNSEQIAAKLLFEITRNTGFETDKSKLGECFVNDCCEWKNREEDDICGLDADRLSSKEKAKLLVEYSILKEAFERAGL